MRQLSGRNAPDDHVSLDIRVEFMTKTMLVRSLAAMALAPLALASLPALAQPADKGSGKIICWKDKSGKVVGCGDRVPPEFQSSGTKELDQRGVTRKTTESADDVAKRQAKEKEIAEQKAVEQKRLAEQKRQDNALLASYTTAVEIDQRRDRDLQPVNQQIQQAQTALKTADEGSKAKLEQELAVKEKEKAEIQQKYAAQKKRFLELKGEAPATAQAPIPAATVPAAPVPAKK